MKKYFIILYIGLVLGLLFVTGCRPDLKRPQPPEIKDGVLDLTNWDFDRNGTVNLAGSWRFYWKQLLRGKDFDTPTAPQMTDLFKIPGSWNKYKVNGKQLNGDGYATFTLDILIPPVDTPLAFNVQYMETAYNLYVDHQRVASNGVVGMSRNSMVPEFRPLTVSFTPSAEQFRIILQISNFFYNRGGPWSVIQLGSAKEIRKVSANRLLSTGFLTGSIFIIGLYHLFLFSLHRKELSFLYFGIFSNLIALRSLLINERYLHNFFPDLNWEFLQKLEYLSFYLAVPVFAMFIDSIFPNEFRTRFLRFTQGISGLFILVVLFSYARIFSATVNTYQVLTIVCGLYIFYVLFKAYRKGREGVFILLCGYLVLFFSFINDTLYANNLIQTGYSISLGMLVFILCQAFMLSQRYSRVFHKNQDQKEKLNGSNAAYQNEVVAKQILEQDLRKSLQDFQDTRFALIMGLAKLAEYRDEDTGSHLERMREYVKILAKNLARQNEYKGYITDDYILDIYYSAILHDIGKVGIRDSVLLKPCKLTPEEFDIMKTHSRIGGDAIQMVENKIQVRSFLTLGKQIAYHHHERWDGAGYPDQLQGENIPLSARITALADVYDALTSVRPYKTAFPQAEAVKIIIEGSGTHFDPNIVEVFMDQLKMFDKIRDYLKD